jgi:hypothetical protein
MLAKVNMDLDNRNKAIKSVCADLQMQINDLNHEQEKMKAQLKNQQATQWSLHARERVKRLCKYMKNLSDKELDDFIQENKESDKPLTLTKADIAEMIEYRCALSDYLSCHVMKFPDKDVADDEVIEFKYAGSKKEKCIQFNRKLVNAMIYLLDKGYGAYLENYL